MEQYVVALHNRHFHRIERHNMVECLHHYCSVVKSHCPTIDKFLGWDTIAIDETVDKRHLAVLYYQTDYSITRANPYIMLAVLDD